LLNNSAKTIIFAIYNWEATMSKPSILDIVKSVFSAFIGVQSDTNRQKDFNQGSLKSYIVAGIIFTIAFIAILVWVVSVVLG